MPGPKVTRGASTMNRHSMQWYDSALIEQIIAGTKTATVRPLEWSAGLDSYNTAIHCGAVYTVHDATRTPRCLIRITGVELCTWGAIPDRLWQRDPASDGSVSLHAFRADHDDYFSRPKDDHEFLAIYFQTVS